MVTFDFYWYQFRYIDVICMDLETFTFTGASLVYKLSDLVIQYPERYTAFKNCFRFLNFTTKTTQFYNSVWERVRKFPA